MLTGGSSLFEYPVGTMRYHGGAPSRLARTTSANAEHARAAALSRLFSNESPTLWVAVLAPLKLARVFSLRAKANRRFVFGVYL